METSTGQTTVPRPGAGPPNVVPYWCSRPASTPASRLATVLAAVITSNTALATMPGNVFLPAAATGLPRDSVINVTAAVTLDKNDLRDRVGSTPVSLKQGTDHGLRRVLDP